MTIAPDLPTGAGPAFFTEQQAHEAGLTWVSAAAETFGVADSVALSWVYRLGFEQKGLLIRPGQRGRRPSLFHIDDFDAAYQTYAASKARCAARAAAKARLALVPKKAPKAKVKPPRAPRPADVIPSARLTRIATPTAGGHYVWRDPRRVAIIEGAADLNKVRPEKMRRRPTATPPSH
ncbi:hypothetical protein [Nocardioides sp. Leaf285]|uniref:hypothetical protein n=1 Tax=Nocardioides sp. Leaf285 TaxID=1736322 RepID=UPI00070399F5|nr:hypothetical protein [Nocardioides sp. Leaf285]KQP63172.1 hypothetical protein ASF47_19370 [Nocardioides sp. Leaf285]